MNSDLELVASQIFVTTSFEGIHSYPHAPDPVGYLRYPHRHLFKIMVQIQVFHDDREIEFIMFKNFIDSLCKEKYLQDKSCESIIEVLALKIHEKYPGRSMNITVSEDGENGAYKSYTSTHPPL